MKKLTLSFVLIIFFVACKTSHREHAGFKHATKNHKTLAVLPVELFMEGKQPKRLKKEQLETLQIAQGLALQQILQKEILDKIQHQKRPAVSIVDADKVNRKIIESGISYASISSTDVEVLAKTINVDAVIQTKIISTRYLSNVASYGIDLGTDILEVLKKFYSIKNVVTAPILNKVEIPDDENQNLTRTNHIIVSIKIIDAKDGSVLWNEIKDFNTNWNHSFDDGMKKAIHDAIANLPY